jgi:hypothetical protein
MPTTSRRATQREPPSTVERLCRDIQAHILLLSELQPGSLVLQVSRLALEQWHNDLARVVVLWLAEHNPHGG